MTTLPRHAPTLIRLALESLEAMQKNPRVIIDMRHWVTRHKRMFRLCLSGCVMVHRLGVSPNPDSEWCAQCGDNQDQLYAINALRTGALLWAARVLGQVKPKALPDFVKVPLFEDGQPAFVAALQALADQWEQAL